MTIKCPDCNRIFKQKNALTYHLKHKVCSKDFKCEFCDKTLKTKNSLYSHKSQFCKMNPKRKNIEIEEQQLNDDKINKLCLTNLL